ncbi:hypothetical protein Ciccas_010098 [Cichlidogyrus casuarinus]|uniref:Uncharacterized protein n=1 Tax=Cichlidogyrus casuarinus TaxID=1844966 RepID=A0ABD2PV32_9PLAT
MASGEVKMEMDSKQLDEWWNKYMKAKLIEDAEVEEMLKQFESHDQLRLKFAEEFKLIELLSQPVLKISEDALQKDKMHRADQLYRDWGSVSSKEYLVSYYNNELFLAVYTKRRFVVSATSFLQALVYRIFPECPEVEPYITTNVSRVISVGCGSGADIAAFLAFFHSRSISRQLVYYAIDQSPGWNQYISALDKVVSAEYRTTIWFKNAFFGMNCSDLDMLPEADMVVFSFANTARINPYIWELMQIKYRLIIVLDGVKEVLKTNFGDVKFKNLRLSSKTTVYFYFRGDS